MTTEKWSTRTDLLSDQMLTVLSGYPLGDCFDLSANGELSDGHQLAFRTEAFLFMNEILVVSSY